MGEAIGQGHRHGVGNTLSPWRLPAAEIALPSGYPILSQMVVENQLIGCRGDGGGGCRGDLIQEQNYFKVMAFSWALCLQGFDVEVKTLLCGPFYHK